MPKKIEFQVGFNVDKKDINELQQLLKSIQTEAAKDTGTGKYSDDLQKAALHAEKLSIMLNKAWNVKLNQLDLSKFNQSVTTAYGSVEQLKKSLESVGRGDVFNKIQSSVLNTNLQLKQSNKLLDNMAQTMANTVRYGIASSVFNRISNEIQNAYNYSVKLDTSLNDIRIVTDKSAEDMTKFAVQANKAAKALGSSTLDYAKASTIYYQQGLSDEETAARTDVTLKAANVTGQTGEEVSEQLTAIWNGYKVSAEESELYIDKVAKVAASTAADLEEMATGMSKVASAANSAGVDIDHLNGMLATVISVTREAPETIGSSFKTIFARLGDLSLGKTDEEGVGLGKVSGQLHNLGIELLDETGNMRDLGVVIEDIAAKWQTWTQAQRQAAAVAMAGKMQYSRLIALFDNWDMYNKAFDESVNAVGTLNEQQNIYMESTEAHLQQLRTEAERTYDILFDQDTVNDFTDALNGALTIFNNFLDTTGGGISSLITLTSTFGNVFSKQIGSGLGQMVQNQMIGQMNSRNMQTAMDFAEVETSQKGISKEELAVREEMRGYSQQMLNLSKNLTSEEYNRLKALKEQAEQDKLRVAALQAQADKDTTSNKVIADLENQKKLIQEQRKSYQQVHKEVKNINDIRSVGIKYEEDRQDILQSQSALLSHVQELSDANLLSEEQQVIFSQAKDRNEKGYILTKKQVSDLDKVANDVLDAQIQKEKQLTQEKELQLELENGGLEIAKNNADNSMDAMQTEIAAKARAAAIGETVRGLTAIISLTTQVVGIINTLNDDSLSGWEKFERIGSTLLFTLPMLITNFSAITKLLPNMAMALGTTATAEEILSKGALKATVSVFGLKMALWEFFVLAGLVIAIIGSLVAIGVSLYNSYNETAKAFEATSEQAEVLKNAFEECDKAAKDLKQTIENYDNSIKALDSLTEGTDEYKKALKEATQQAEELIQKYNLLAGTDYTIDEKGIVRFDTQNGNSLERKQQELEQKANDLNSQQLAAAIRAAETGIDSKTLEYQRKTGINANSEIERRYDKLEAGTSLIPVIGPLLTIGESLGRMSSEVRGYNLNNSDVDELRNAFTKSGIDYTTILKQSEDNVRKWILENDNLSESVKANVDNIVKEKDALISLISATKGFEDTLAKKTEELNLLHISNNKEISDKIKAISKDENGEENQGLQTLISKALSASDSGQAMANSERSNLDLARLSSKKVKSNKDLENFVKNNGLDASALGITDMNDKKTAEAYLKHVLGYSDEDLAHIKIKDNWGNTTATWDSDYTDSKGQQHNSSDEIYKELNDETARSTIAYQLKVKELSKQADENAKIFLEESTNAIQKMINATSEMSTNYGTDISNIILNSMAGRQDGVNGILDFTNAFSVLSDEQIDNLIQLTPEGLAEALHMTEDDFWNLGYEGAEAFEKAFDQGLFEKERKALENLLQNVNTYGGNGNNLSDEQYNNLATQMSKDMSASQMQSLSSSPLSLSQIDFNTEDLDKVTEQLSFMAECIDRVNDAGVSLTQEQKEQAKELGYSEKALQAYAEELENSNEVLKDNDKAAADIALANVRMNKGIDTLAKNFEHWQAVLKEGNKNSGEYYEVLAQLKEAAEDMFGVSVSNAFLQDANNLAKMKELAEGNVEVFDELQEAAMRDYVMHLAVVGPDEATVDGIRNSILSMVDDINSRADIEIGTELDDGYVDQLNEMLAKGQITEEQMNKILAGIGYSPTITYKKEARTTETKHDVSADIFGQKVHVGTVYDAQTSYVDVPQIEGGSNSGKSGPTYVGKPKSSGINYSNGAGRKAANAKKGRGGGGGGSEKDPKQIEQLDDKADRYHQIDVQIKLVETALSRLEKQQKKTFGKDYLTNLNKQYAQLQKQVDNYNKKIKIAQSEQDELRKKLAGQGVKFNGDGTISNYMDAFAAQQQKVNDLIKEYNSLSAEQQEQWDKNKKVDKAKEEFNKFKENLDRYDTLVTDFIPGLQDSIQDAIDKQIEINIQKFNYEIDLRLNMKEAERDWNDFRKKVINQIRDDDILGNLKANLKQYSDYFEGAAGNIIGQETAHLRDLVGQINQINSGGWSSAYGDNKAQALEDLKKYLDELTSNMKNMQDLTEEIRQAYLDMLDEAADKFEEQIDLYGQIDKMIEHDMKAIELIRGETAYKEMDKYLQKQKDNNKQQLVFNKQQEEFWKQRVADTKKMADNALTERNRYKQGTTEWDQLDRKYRDMMDRYDAAVEHYQDSLEATAEQLEKSLEDAAKTFENSLNIIFQELNNKVTNGMGLEYVSEEWRLINENADQYLDTINSLYGIQKIENKYLDAIDQTDNVSAQRKLKDLMQEEVKALQEKDKLTQYDIDRAEMKYQIALKQIALEEAQQNKSSMRLRRDSQGNYSYQFVADNDNVAQTQEELSDLYNQLYNFDLEHYRSNLDKLYDVWEEFQEKMAEAAKINDPEERAARELLLREQYGQLINGLVEQNETLRLNLEESGFKELADLRKVDVDDFRGMSADERDILMGEMVPQWESGVQQMADKFAGEGGFEQTVSEAMDNISQTTAAYDQELLDLAEDAGKPFDELVRGIDYALPELESFLDNNEQLIKAYDDQVGAIQSVEKELDILIDKYKTAKKNAEAATEAAYKLWQEENRKAAEKAEKERQKQVAQQPQNQPKQQSQPVTTSSGGSGGSGGGDGKLSVGDTATYTGGPYFSDSYGGGPSGNRGPGKKVKITVVKTDGRPYPIHVTSNDSAYGWLKKEQLTGYATGGYTGDWGDSSGKLALLHKKEMVLNAEDTRNMLSAVEILRNVTDNIGSSLLMRMANITSGMSAPNAAAADDGILEQNVHIEATFPDVKDATEIETALRNLVNVASQRAHRIKR